MFSDSFAQSSIQISSNDFYVNFTLFFYFPLFLSNLKKKKKGHFALAGNRTRASRVAGENSTTEPPVQLLRGRGKLVYLSGLK